MISSAAIAQLSAQLERLRSGGDDVEIVRWLRDFSPQVASLAPPCHSDRGYTRTLLHRGQTFEIVAIHWEPNVVTPIHDHGGALCWLAVAGGSMQVDNYLRLDDGQTDGYARIALEGREELACGGIDYRQDDVHLHRCLTRGERTTSLHVYAHPIDTFFMFDERANTCAPTVSTYDAVPAV